MKLFNNELPVKYDQLNTIYSHISPSTVHTTNTELHAYFCKYLFQKLLSVYNFNNLPKTWDKGYFLSVLFANGYIAVIETKEYGVVPQNCGLSGYNLFYRPDKAIIANPLIKTDNKGYKIGKDCEIIKLMPDYGSPIDKVSFYADMLALSAEGAGMNLVNSKLSYVMSAKNKAGAESLKKMYDNVASGEPAVVIDKSLYNQDGSTAWDTFAQNLRENYIAGNILDDMKKWENAFNTDIGIPNANTNKRERLISDEVNANNVETYTTAELWLETLKESIDKVNTKYNLSITVDFRNKPEKKIISSGGNTNEK